MTRRAWELATRRPAVTAAALALTALLTIAAAWLYAHEGHEALPSRGVETVKDKTGRVVGINLGPESLRALDVQVADVVPVSLDDRLAVPATVVVPWDRHAFVTSRLGGKVAALHVRPGEAVARDQVVAEVESMELADLQRELLDARNEAGLAAKNLADLKEGNRRGSIPDYELREGEAQDRQARDALDVARRRLLGLGVPPEAVEALLRDREPRPVRTLPVRSPVAGVAVHVDVAVGQVVEPGDHLLEVTDLSRVWVRLAVLEKDLHRLEGPRWWKRGQEVTPRFPAAPREGGWPATLSVKGQSLDAQTGWGTAWADLDNADGRLLPGMVGQAQIRLPAARRGLLVPAEAVAREGAERFVLVEVAPGQYQRRDVVVEAGRGGRVQVSRSTGLFPGDRVVTAGSHELASIFSQGVLRLSPEAERGIGLDVRPARREPVAEVVTFAAVADLPPSARAVASSRLPGTVQRLAVGRDQQVRAGDLLAEVFSPELLNLQLDLLRTDSQAAFLEERLGRLRSARKDVVPERTARETESALTTARQRREALRRKLLDAGLSGEDLRALLAERRVVEALPVRAPVGGTVVGFRAVLGQAVKAEAPLFEVHDLTQVVLRVHVPERQLPALRLGQAGRVRLEADPGFTGRAVLGRSAQALDPDDRAMPVWADLADRPRAPLLPGMTARLTLPVTEPVTVLAVPAGAVLRDGRSAFLFVRRKDGSFERREVRTGRGDDLFTEVTEGLSEGEEVAVRGVADLETAYAAVR